MLLGASRAQPFTLVNMRATTFRGYHAIGEVIEYMAPLAGWLTANRPAVTILTLRRRDLDLLQRWPQAASIHGIVTTHGISYWRGFTLRADASRARYRIEGDTRQAEVPVS